MPIIFASPRIGRIGAKCSSPIFDMSSGNSHGWKVDFDVWGLLMLQEHKNVNRVARIKILFILYNLWMHTNLRGLLVKVKFSRLNKVKVIITHNIQTGLVSFYSVETNIIKKKDISPVWCYAWVGAVLRPANASQGARLIVSFFLLRQSEICRL
jgi:hypothetical protein